MTSSRFLIAGLVSACVLRAAAAGAADERAPLLPSEKPVVTHHHAHVGGHDLRYTARAGVLVIKSEDGKPTTSMSYVAYTRDGDAAARRPLSFVYNGGPGSSTFWLHMGAFGPRRVLTTNAGPTPPPPYRLVDNEESPLDVSDLVFVDAPGTGYGRAYDAKAVFGVDEDAKTFAGFVQTFISRNERWNSPKFLIGESYGTTRSANLVNVLAQRGIACNGVVLISTALDYATIVGAPGNDLPFALFLPTMAAVAAYHHALPRQPADLPAFLNEVRTFARTDYTTALAQGDRLDAPSRARLVHELHAYTGLSEQFIDLANLRVTPNHFEKELLRTQRRTVGRLDGRFTGIDRDPTSDSPDYDPTDSALTPVYTALFNSYSREALEWKPAGEQYRTNDYDEAFHNWNFKRGEGGFAGRVLAPAVINDLRQALSQNPALRVLAVNGWYDLATPFMGTEYTLGHLGLDPTLASHVSFDYYPSGHMIYGDPASRVQLAADLRRFIAGAAP